MFSKVCIKKWAVISSYVQYLHSKLWIFRAFLSSFYVSFHWMETCSCILDVYLLFWQNLNIIFLDVFLMFQAQVCLMHLIRFVPQTKNNFKHCLLHSFQVFSILNSDRTVQLCKTEQIVLWWRVFRLGYLFPMQRSTENWLRHIQ